ncbi:MAG: TIGR00269 family protein [Candidatus Methanodesulfokora sp.]
MRRCDRCGGEAIIYIRAKREALCENCLLTSIRRRAYSVLRRDLSDGDFAVVALSGGKDSSLSLLMTKEFIEREKIDARIAALTVDEGTSYRRASIEMAKKLTSKLGVEHKIVRMRDFHGFSIEDIKGKKLPNERRSACTYCGVLRRQMINTIAREWGATKVITGHNLDDLVQTFVMNLVRGDISALSRFLSREPPSSFLVQRVRPLMYIYEKEVAAYCLAAGVPAHVGKCPLTQGMRIGIRRALDEMELISPGFKLNLLKSAEKIISSSRRRLSEGIELRRCEICGEPTTERICKACQLKAELVNIIKG